jgi:hypothetical protein
MALSGLIRHFTRVMEQLRSNPLKANTMSDFNSRWFTTISVLLTS